MLIHHHLLIFVHKHVYWRWVIRLRYFNICRLVVQFFSFAFSSGDRSLCAFIIVASLIPIAEEAKTGVSLQCDDSSCVDSFLLSEESDVDFFAFTTRDEDLLDSDEGSARISLFKEDPCKAVMSRAFKRSKEDIQKKTAYLLYVAASAA